MAVLQDGQLLSLLAEALPGYKPPPLADVTPAAAHALLSKPDVTVTNQSDKESAQSPSPSKR